MKDSIAYYERQNRYQTKPDGSYSNATMMSELLGMAVLVVEDNQFNQQLVKTLLNSAGVHVTVSSGGAEAIEQSKEYRFDAVLMDIQMPGMDGLETTRIIREDPRNHDLPIFAMTANATQEDIHRYVSAGMNGTIAKPLHYQSLFDMLKSCVQRANLPTKSTGDALGGSRGNSAHFYPQVAIDRVGSDEIFLHMLDKFIPYYGQSVLKIMVAIVDSNFDEAKRIAHTLKGAAGTIGAPLLSDLARQLEIAFTKQESRRYSELLEKLRDELSLVVMSIESYLDRRH